MALHRFFLTGPLPADVSADQIVTLALDMRDVRHATRVLRLGPGGQIVVVDTGGAVWKARITSASDAGIVVALIERVEDERLPYVTLVAGVTKGDKIDLAVEKCVEIGVSRVMPILAERSVVRFTPEKASARGDRWRRVAAAAAKQAQRASVPMVDDPVALFEVAQAIIDSHDVVLVAWEDAAATAPGIGEALDEAGANTESRVAVVVGPEGGLTAAEVYGFERAGARAVSLGGCVLRAETAGIVAAAVALYELGALGGRARG